MNSNKRLRITNGLVRETYFASAQTGNIFVTHERRGAAGKRWMATGTQEVSADKAREVRTRLTAKS